MEYTVWQWMKISETEYRALSGKGVCVKCGKPTKSRWDNLCRGHRSAYHRWLNKNRSKLLVGERKCRRK